MAVGALLRRRLLGEFYVLVREANGMAKVLVDWCPHRVAPLSRGVHVDILRVYATSIGGRHSILTVTS